MVHFGRGQLETPFLSHPHTAGTGVGRCARRLARLARLASPAAGERVRAEDREVDSNAMKATAWAVASGMIALAVASCESDRIDDGGGWATPSTSPCALYTSCAACTPVSGCGWCFDSNGVGECAPDPDSCATPAFSWTWDPDGCRTTAAAGSGVAVTTPDAGAAVVLDASQAVEDAAADAGAAEAASDAAFAVTADGPDREVP